MRPLTTVARAVEDLPAGPDRALARQPADGFAARWRVVAAVIPILLACSGSAAAAEPSPKRGGTLEFAVLVEPSEYDCHANISFAVLHPVAPH